MRVGAILFDSDNNIVTSGNSIVSLGSAWTAIGREKPTRITNIHDLDSDVTWYTNISYKNFYLSGLNKHPNFKHDGWLRSMFNQLIAEIGLDPRYVQPHDIVSAMAIIADNTISISSGRYAVTIKSHNRLNEDFAIAFQAPRSKLPDEIYSLFETIAAHPSVSVIKKVNYSQSLPTLTLRRNRLCHARQVMGTAVPSDMNWEYASSKKLHNPHTLYEFDKPFLVKATLSNINPTVAEILSWSSGSQKMRDWLTDSEFRAVMDYADITIHKVIHSQISASPITQKHPLPSGKFDELSVSLGIVAEQIWTAHTNKQPFRGNLSRFNAAAAWLRASDRLLMFDYAKKLFAHGLNVMSYGVGNVVLRYPEKGLNRAMDIATDIGLLPPASKFLELEQERKLTGSSHG